MWQVPAKGLFPAAVTRMLCMLFHPLILWLPAPFLTGKNTIPAQKQCPAFIAPVDGSLRNGKAVGSKIRPMQ